MRVHIFRNPEKYQELIRLLKEGKGVSDIARRFGVDHTTILYHKNKIAKNIPYKRMKKVGKPKPTARELSYIRSKSARKRYNAEEYERCWFCGSRYDLMFHEGDNFAHYICTEHFWDDEWYWHTLKAVGKVIHLYALTSPHIRG
jgi:hypothetical protein